MRPMDTAAVTVLGTITLTCAAALAFLFWFKAGRNIGLLLLGFIKLALLPFFVFGYLASGELDPAAAQPWKLGYAAAFLIFLTLGLFWVFLGVRGLRRP